MGAGKRRNLTERKDYNLAETEVQFSYVATLILYGIKCICESKSGCRFIFPLKSAKSK